MLNKDYESAAFMCVDDNGKVDFKMLCDYHIGFRSEIMSMSKSKIVKKLNVTENYAQSLQHYAWLSFSNERIKNLNKKD